MADQPTGRTFSEGEAYAIAEDAVKRETAAFQTQVDGLTSEKAALETKVDVLEVEKAGLVERAEKAEKELADFKESVERDKEIAARREVRVAKLAEIAPTLELDEARTTRILAMSDEAFEEYCGDISQVAAKAPALDKDGKPVAPAPVIPKQSAAFGGSGDEGTPQGVGVIDLFGARRASAN